MTEATGATPVGTAPPPATTPTRPTAARWWHGAVAVIALVGVLMEVVTAVVEGPGTAPTHTERIVRVFSYFTIQSNLLVGITCLLLALDPRRDGPVFRVARLDGLLCIAVTGVVYHTALRGLVDLTGAGVISNLLLHTGAPVVAVMGWLLVGPRPRTGARTVWWSVVLPLAWIAYTFLRGAVVDWYPYPFLDVSAIGYPQALASTAVVAVLFLALAAVVGVVDRRLRPAP
ncbi:Pr6Pr family membrane protein [Oerskovia flava]|uniref:Pr6Pr family membrane protein n=1 Tax=Oerskovia flava TaxID=2986422 RepID=UPI002240D32D|nr:Pr6Pr family membrane protein [Oerskovia sp. JB1-3-2]